MTILSRISKYKRPDKLQEIKLLVKVISRVALMTYQYILLILFTMFYKGTIISGMSWENLYNR